MAHGCKETGRKVCRSLDAQLPQSSSVSFITKCVYVYTTEPMFQCRKSNAVSTISVQLNKGFRNLVSEPLGQTLPIGSGQSTKV